MKELYLKITNKLTSEEAINKFSEKNVRAVGQVDLYRGQYLYEQDFEQLILPAVLMEYSINVQNNSATINLHCCWEQFYETDNKSFDQDKALHFFDWQDVLYNLLYELESKNTGKLTLVTESSAKDDTPTNVHIFTFECSYMGRVKKADDGYEYAQGEDITANGTINIKPDPEYDFEL